MSRKLSRGLCRMRNRVVYSLRSAVGCIIIALLALTSCKSIEYIPIESVKYQDREIERVKIDTIRDSRFVYIKGDTVIDTRYRERISIQRDTCYISIRDSISVPCFVEKKLSKWQQAKIDYGGYAMLLVLFLVAWLLKKLFP